MAREALHDLFFNPGEGRNLIGEPEYAPIADELRGRLERWMQDTNDPLLDGPVPAPAGARLNAQDQRSASEPTFVAPEPAAQR